MSKYKFLQKNTGQWIETEEEIWKWEAHYSDGSVLKQFDDDLNFHQFIEIDQSRLALFKMTSSVYPQVYTLVFSDPTMKLIHFYRNTVLNTGTPDEKKIRLYCFGYEQVIGPKNHKVIMIITPSNNLIVTEDPNLVVIS